MEKSQTFIIQGKTDLLCHNPAGMGEKKPQGGTKGKQIIYDDQEEAAAGLYVDDGKFCFPGIGIRNGMVRAAGDWKPLSGKKRGTLTSSVAHIMVAPDMIPSLGPNDKPLKSYTIDKRRVVVQRNGIVRCRPKFHDWKLKFEIIYDDEILALSVEEIHKLFGGLLDDAGRRFGLGDYRPAMRGWFGQFRSLD
jgi:hypothetical protein